MDRKLDCMTAPTAYISILDNLPPTAPTAFPPFRAASGAFVLPKNEQLTAAYVLRR